MEAEEPGDRADHDSGRPVLAPDGNGSPLLPHENPLPPQIISAAGSWAVASQEGEVASPPLSRRERIPLAPPLDTPGLEEGAAGAFEGGDLSSAETPVRNLAGPEREQEPDRPPQESEDSGPSHPGLLTPSDGTQATGVESDGETLQAPGPGQSVDSRRHGRVSGTVSPSSSSTLSPSSTDEMCIGDRSCDTQSPESLWLDPSALDTPGALDAASPSPCDVDLQPAGVPAALVRDDPRSYPQSSSSDGDGVIGPAGVGLETVGVGPQVSGGEDLPAGPSTPEPPGDLLADQKTSVLGRGTPGPPATAQCSSRSRPGHSGVERPLPVASGEGPRQPEPRPQDKGDVTREIPAVPGKPTPKGSRSAPGSAGLTSLELRGELTYIVLSPGPGACTSTPIPGTQVKFPSAALDKLLVSSCQEGKAGAGARGGKGLLAKNLGPPTGSAAGKLNPRPGTPAGGRLRKAQIVSFPRPNFQNVRPKVISRLVPGDRVPVRSPQVSASPRLPAAGPRPPCSVRPGATVPALAGKAGKQPPLSRPSPGPAGQGAARFRNAGSQAPWVAPGTRPSGPQGLAVPAAAGVHRRPRPPLDSQRESTRVLGETFSPSSEPHGSRGPEPTREKLDETYDRAPLDWVSGGAAKTPLGHSPPSQTSPLSCGEVPVLPAAGGNSSLSPHQNGNGRNVRPNPATSPPREQPPTASRNPAVACGRASFLKRCLPSGTGEDPASPRRRPVAKKVCPVTGAVPRLQLPPAGPVRLRTPSGSSISSSRSGGSTSSGSAINAAFIKNRKNPLPTTFSNGIPAPVFPKPPAPRVRLPSARSPAKGTKSKVAASGPGLAPSPRGPSRAADAKTRPFLGSRQNVSRLLFPASNLVERSKEKTGGRPGPHLPASPDRPPPDSGPELARIRATSEKQHGTILQLRRLLVSGSRGVEALAVVIQHLLAEREEALKQRKAASQELATLREELVLASTAREQLERDKRDLQTTYEGLIQKLDQHYQADRTELEERLRDFYTAECEKLRTLCIREAENYKEQLQGQVDTLKTSHEAFKQACESSHAEKIDLLREEYETSLSEIKKSHEQERKSLEDSLLERRELLEKQILELQAENEAVGERLKQEEQRRLSREKADQNPQLMYLEQELESLRAVLEIKNEKLHQQDIKLLKMEKLVDHNAALVEKLQRLQQENEELKARMDKHLAFSRQLSTEQAVLQESLEKESKVNKRLSMENEELLWKLHNGDLCSPRRSPPAPRDPSPSSSPR